MVLNRKSSETENLEAAIKSSIGNEASCTRLSDTATVEMRDADEEVSNEEIIKALEAHTKGQGTTRIISKRMINRGTQIITASVPTTAISMLLKTRLRIGFVNCRVKRMIDIQKYFRYQGFGHTRLTCTYDERSNLCWKCGEKGHKNPDYDRDAQCFLCKGKKSCDHRLGSYKFHVYISAMEAEKQRI